MTDDFSTPPVAIPRDHWGRPMVIPVGGGKPTPYTRCTTFVGVLEDTYNLSRWQQRMVAVGLNDRPDLALAVAAHRDDKVRLSAICDEAMEAAKAHAGATTGTALHALTEQHDRGQLIGIVPPSARADLDAYAAATAGMSHVLIENFTVLDALSIGGTPDRVVQWMARRYIFDLKTGSIDYGMGKIAQQLAVYAHSEAYDVNTHERTPLHVDQRRAIVCHLPAGQATCTLWWVDIHAGWEGVQLSAKVREWRKRKDLSSPFTEPMATVTTITPPSLPEQIAACETVEALTALWWSNSATWTEELSQLARARKHTLTTGEIA